MNTYFNILERSCAQEGGLGFHCMPQKLKSNWNKKAEAKEHVYCMLTSVPCTSCEKVAVFIHRCVNSWKWWKPSHTSQNEITAPRTLTWSRLLQMYTCYTRSSLTPSHPWQSYGMQSYFCKRHAQKGSRESKEDCYSLAGEAQDHKVQGVRT